MLRLNIGSGQRCFPAPWINTDIVNRPQYQAPDMLMDATGHWPWDDGDAEYVVLHHVIEHVGCGEADPMLREAWRVLHPGGSVLIFVPNMRTLAQRWLIRQMDDQLYFTNLYGAYHGEEADRHHWGYTYESLTETLKRCGEWSAIKMFDWREVPAADLARDWWILGMEAVK